MQNDRESACKDCLVTKGVVSEEECIGCNGEKNCNEDYFPKQPQKKIFTEEEEFQMLKNKYTDITKFSSFNMKEFLKYLKMKKERDKKPKIYIIK
jgi:hypothetical protein